MKFEAKHLEDSKKQVTEAIEFLSQRLVEAGEALKTGGIDSKNTAKVVAWVLATAQSLASTMVGTLVVEALKDKPEVEAQEVRDILARIAISNSGVFVTTDDRWANVFTDSVVQDALHTLAKHYEMEARSKLGEKLGAAMGIDFNAVLNGDVSSLQAAADRRAQANPGSKFSEAIQKEVDTIADLVGGLRKAG